MPLAYDIATYEKSPFLWVMRGSQVAIRSVARARQPGFPGPNSASRKASTGSRSLPGGKDVTSGKALAGGKAFAGGKSVAKDNVRRLPL